MTAELSSDSFESRNKLDLMIEIWERLDCESVGAAEIKAIEEAVRNKFGGAAVDSPMVIARLLADEGAELRHSEILDLYVGRNAETIYEAALRNLIDIESLEKASASLMRMENLRRKYTAENDREGLRLLREKTIKFKETAHERSLKSGLGKQDRLMNAEVAEWLTIWLRTPEIFHNWLALRLRSEEFRAWFGEEKTDA